MAGNGPACGELLEVAARLAQEIIGKMTSIRLEPYRSQGEPCSHLAEASGCIPVTTPEGGWNLAVSCSRQSGERLAAAVLGLESGEAMDPETVSDALGEVVNLLAGALKSEFSGGSSGWRLGLPLYIEGSGWFLHGPSASRFTSQRLQSDDLSLQVVVCWREPG